MDPSPEAVLPALPRSKLPAREQPGLTCEILLLVPRLSLRFLPNFIVNVPSTSWCRRLSLVNFRLLGSRANDSRGILRLGLFALALEEAVERNDAILPKREVLLGLGRLGVSTVATAEEYWPSSLLRLLDEVEEADFRMMRFHVSLIAIVKYKFKVGFKWIVFGR